MNHYSGAQILFILTATPMLPARSIPIRICIMVTRIDTDKEVIVGESIVCCAPDPILSDYLRVTTEQNYGGVADVELDKLIDELGRTFDMTRRAELLARIQQIVIADKAYEVRVVFTRSRAVVGRAYRSAAGWIGARFFYFAGRGGGADGSRFLWETAGQNSSPADANRRGLPLVSAWSPGAVIYRRRIGLGPRVVWRFAA